MREAQNPAVAIDDDGAALLLWVAKTAPVSLQSSYLPANSLSWNVPTQVDSGVGNVRIYPLNYKNPTRSNPQVTLKNHIGFAAWAQVGTDSTLLYVSRHDSGGWGAPVAMKSASGAVAANARVVSDAFGNATVVWVQYQSESVNDGSLVYSRYNSATAMWGEPTVIATGYFPNVVGVLQLIMDKNNVPNLLWLEGSDSAQRSLKFARLPLDASVSLVTVAQGELVDTALTLSNDDFQPLAVWTSYDTSGYSNVMLSRYSESGWGAAVAIGIGSAPAISVLPKGDLVVAWNNGSKLYTKEYLSTSGWQAYRQAYDLGAVSPQVVSDELGNVEMIWYGSHTYQSRRSVEGEWSMAVKPFGGDLFPGYNNGLENRLVMNAAGRAIAAWTVSSGTYKVQASLLNP